MSSPVRAFAALIVLTLTVLALLASYAAKAQELIPPGAINPAVTQANIGTTICVHGWTKTIRPPASYTTKLKKQQMLAEHLTGTARQYEEDHLISLEIGGNPTDPNNLWPQPWLGPHNAHHKDKLENALHRDVCSGKESLADAQHEIATDWVGAYERRFGAEP